MLELAAQVVRACSGVATVEHWTRLVHLRVLQGDMQRAQEVVDEDMKAADVRPTVRTLNTLVDGWVKQGDMRRAEEVVDVDMKAAGVRPDLVHTNGGCIELLLHARDVVEDHT